MKCYLSDQIKGTCGIMEEDKLEGKMPLGRLRRRWDDVKLELNNSNGRTYSGFIRLRKGAIRGLL